MLYGIKYQPNKRGLKSIGSSMEKYGCGIYTYGKCSLYFTNVIEAYLMSKELSSYHKDLTYKVFIAKSKDLECLTAYDIVHSRAEYKAKTKEQFDKIMQEHNLQQNQNTIEETQLNN